MPRPAFKVGWIAVLVLAVVSCQKPIDATLGKPVDLSVKHGATFVDSDLDLFFLRVASDSRCPKGAQCITAGEAVVTLEGRILKGTPEPFEVRLADGGPSDSSMWTAYRGHRIRLVKLDPHPSTSVMADTNAYIGTFIVEAL